MADYADLYPALGYSFKNKKLLKQALTLGFGDHFSGYERLEFLGDRVLGVVVAQMLYQHYPDEAEGDLAKRFSDLTRAETLAVIAKELGLSRYLASTVPSNKLDLTKAVLSDVCEAVIAALFLDGGFDVACQFVVRYWTDPMHKFTAPPVDAKTKLQEWAQAGGLPLPEYIQLDRTGPDHDPVFTMQVVVQGQPSVRAVGKSKREASQNAAAELLKMLENHG